MLYLLRRLSKFNKCIISFFKLKIKNIIILFEAD